MSTTTPPADAATLSDADWLRRFATRVVLDRVPSAGLLELTSRCNLRCVHCYLGAQEQHWDPRRRARELSLEKLLSIIDEIADAGCMFLGITGGDPMVHEHFAEVYRHACERGIKVSVLCNGVLVRDEVVELFREYPPTQVEVSLYGATRETYEAVTEVPGSYVKCLNGIRKLVDNGIPVLLKTVLMKLNAHELQAMRDIAAGLGVDLRVDSAIFPQLTDQDRKPLAQRLSPEESVALELADSKVLSAWAERVQRDVPVAEGLYRCGAGVTGFYIDPFGNVSPCIMTTHKRHSLLERSFASLWARELEQIKRVQPGPDYGCNTCDMRMACTSCPGFNYQENGRDDLKSEYICETTRERWTRVQLEVRRTSEGRSAGAQGWTAPVGTSPTQADAPSGAS